MKNILAFFGGILVFVSFGARGVWAVTTSISNVPSVVGQDPFNLTVSIAGAKAAKNYLRVDIYKEGTSEYKGQTFNGTDWYDGEDALSYFPIDIIGSEVNVATLSAKLSTIPSSWSAQDTFRLRVRRYTASGSYTSAEADGSAIPISIIIPSPTPTPLPSPTSTIEPTSPPTSGPTPTGVTSLIENIFITEAMVAPETGQNEWVKLYNDNNEPVTLFNWFIDDVENGGSSPKQFSTSIEPHAYAVVELASALFNNDGDSVRLLNNLLQQVDSFTYTHSERGKSVGRNDTSGVLSPTLTPGVLGESLEISSSEAQLDTMSTVTRIPLNRPIIGDKSQEPTPFDIQGELGSPVLRSIFPNNNFSGLVKATATSSAGISLLNIAYILYRMRKWHLPEM